MHIYLGFFDSHWRVDLLSAVEPSVSIDSGSRTCTSSCFTVFLCNTSTVRTVLCALLRHSSLGTQARTVLCIFLPCSSAEAASTYGISQIFNEQVLPELLKNNPGVFPQFFRGFQNVASTFDILVIIFPSSSLLLQIIDTDC